MGRFANMVCPLCARNRKILSSRWSNPEIRWDFWNKNSPLIQIQEGGGKKKAEETSELFTLGSSRIEVQLLGLAGPRLRP